MKGRASSSAARVDLRDRCRRLDLTATGEDEERFLAALYWTIFGRGGTIEVKSRGCEPYAIEFSSMSPPESEAPR